MKWWTVVIGMILCGVAYAGHYEEEETDIYIWSDLDYYGTGGAGICSAYASSSSIVAEVIVDSGSGDGIAYAYVQASVNRRWRWKRDYPGDDPPSNGYMVRMKLDSATVSVRGTSLADGGWEYGTAGCDGYAYVSYPTSSADAYGRTWTECTTAGYDSGGEPAICDGGEAWWDWDEVTWWSAPDLSEGHIGVLGTGSEPSWVYYGPVGGEIISYWFDAGVDAEACADQVDPYEMDGCAAGLDARAEISLSIELISE